MANENVTKDRVRPFLKGLYEKERTVREVVRLTGASKVSVLNYLSEYKSILKKKKLLKALRNKSIAENITTFRLEPKLFLTHKTEFEVLQKEKRLKLKIDDGDRGQTVYAILN